MLHDDVAPNSDIVVSPSLGETLSQMDFDRLSRFIHEHWGIKIPPAKKFLLEGRIRKRMRMLGIDSFHKYCRYLFSSKGLAQEPLEMIDLVTTNKTDFFREPAHFKILSDRLLPELYRKFGIRSSMPLKVWSAGCSTGEEPYTIAMVLEEFSLLTPGFHYSVFASDISKRVLETARIGIYEEEKITPIPIGLRKKYLLRSKDAAKRQIRVNGTLRNKIHFERLNLLEDSLSIPKPFHVIFCRNVLIYFDHPTQEKIVKSFVSSLLPGGILILGHSEHLTRMDVSLKSLAPTVYRV